MNRKISLIQIEIVIFDFKYYDLGLFFKILLFLIGSIYLLRFALPFILKYVIQLLLKKRNKFSNSKPKTKYKNKSFSDSLGEYIDYEEVD